MGNPHGRILSQLVVFDTADLDEEAGFWARLLGGEVDDVGDPGWRTVIVDGEARIAFQSAPGHVPPSWPEGQQQQAHLDLFVADIREAHDHAVAAGATLLRAAADLDAGPGFQVYADPSGHPFCLCWT